MVVFLNVLNGVNFNKCIWHCSGKSKRHLNSSSHSLTETKYLTQKTICHQMRPLGGKSLGSSTLGASYQQTHSLQGPRRKDTEVY